MKSNHGFTVIEIIIVIALFAVASSVFFVQKTNFETTVRDDSRKTSINALYYSLEEVFFKENKYYPQSLDEEVLPSVDPDLFLDPSGIAIGESASNLRYEPLDCEDDKCKSYTLRTALENEADFIRESRN